MSKFVVGQKVKFKDKTIQELYGICTIVKIGLDSFHGYKIFLSNGQLKYTLNGNVGDWTTESHLMSARIIKVNTRKNYE